MLLGIDTDDNYECVDEETLDTSDYVLAEDSAYHDWEYDLYNCTTVSRASEYIIDDIEVFIVGKSAAHQYGYKAKAKIGID